MQPGAHDSNATPARQAAILLVGKVLGTLSDAVVPLLIVRIWGKADVGSLSSALLLYSAVTTVLMAGFPDSATYFLPGRPVAERRRIVGRIGAVMLGVGALASVILFAVAGAAAWWSADHVAGDVADWSAIGRYLPWLAGLALVDLPGRLVTNVLVVEQRAKTTAALGVIRGLGSSAAALVPAITGGSPIQVVWGTAAFLTLYSVSTLWLVHRLYAGLVARSTDPGPDTTTVTRAQIIRFSVPFGLTEIASIVNAQLDRYLVLAFFTMESFADYQAGAWQVPIIGSIPSLVAVAYAPHMVVWFRDGKFADVLATWRRLATKMALLVTPLAAVFVVGAEETMELLFTSAYSTSASIFRISSIFVMVRITAFGNVLVAAGRPDLITRASFLSVVSNAVLTSLCLWLVGLDGAALGTLLAFIPTVLYYSMAIGVVLSVPLRATYPLLAHLRVVAMVGVAALPAIAIKLWLPWGPGLRLMLEAVTLWLSFAAVGTWSGLIEPADWQFLGGWFRKKLGKAEQTSS